MMTGALDHPPSHDRRPDGAIPVRTSWTVTSESVLVLSGRLPSLVAVRSLAAAGYRVVAGDGGEYSLVGYSRHCHETWPHPPIRDGEAFLAALAELLARRPEIGAVLPLQDPYVALLAANRQRLPERVVVAIPNTPAVQACLDKGRMYEIAAESHVPHHPVERATDLDELVAAAERVGYPCIVRPAAWTGPLPELRKAVICPDRATLDRLFAAWPGRLGALLVQRYAASLRANVYFVARAGRILERVEIKILRTDRIDGTGLAVQGVIVAPDPRLVRYCDALVERLGYTGVGNAQFLVPDQGDPHLLEINPRYGGGAYAVAKLCGVDLTLAAIELASEGGRWSAGLRAPYPVGRRYAWTSRDLYGLAMTVSRGEIGRRGALRWLAGALRAAISADMHLTWAWRDPMPTLAVYAHLLSLGPWRRARRRTVRSG
jgi:predicted ATP-grasp superfamily ATP-dependent carboligase